MPRNGRTRLDSEPKTQWIRNAGAHSRAVIEGWFSGSPRSTSESVPSPGTNGAMTPLLSTLNFGGTAPTNVVAKFSVKKCRNVNDGVTASLTDELVPGDVNEPRSNELVLVTSGSDWSSVTA